MTKINHFISNNVEVIITARIDAQNLLVLDIKGFEISTHPNKFFKNKLGLSIEPWRFT